MNGSDTVTVYWTPAFFKPEENSWSMAYSSPIHVLNEYRKIQNEVEMTRSMFACPGTSGSLKNVYSVNQQFDDVFDLPEYIDPNATKYWLDVDSRLSVYVPRPSALKDHISLQYNMGWLMFADEPLIARFTAPYFPPKSPTNGAILSCGEFDIGSWYRPFNLDYHIPLSAKTMSFEKDDPLFYVEFKTDKKVEIKRYVLSERLYALSTESVNAPERYGAFKSLKERYSMSKSALIPEQVLTEIKKNLVE
jgi:hypothetical protein